MCCAQSPRICFPSALKQRNNESRWLTSSTSSRDRAPSTVQRRRRAPSTLCSLSRAKACAFCMFTTQLECDSLCFLNRPALHKLTNGVIITLLKRCTCVTPLFCKADALEAHSHTNRSAMRVSDVPRHTAVVFVRHYVISQRRAFTSTRVRFRSAELEC